MKETLENPVKIKPEEIFYETSWSYVLKIKGKIIDFDKRFITKNGNIYTLEKSYAVLQGLEEKDFLF